MSHDASLRPRDHFTPRRGWMNDPNGLVLHDGEYHLFFQHLPDSLVHGPMSWGHAVSEDLLDWTELPVALAATDTEHVWSGSVVHDAADTSGLGADGVDGAGPLVALWTAFEPVGGMQRQSLSWSVDRGRTWTSYAANPVLDIGSTAFRDPKVLRDGDGWLMVLVLSDERTVETYRSPDLLRWEHASSFGPAGSVEGIWECPDLLRVPVEGRDETAVVLLVSVQEGAPAGGSGMQYWVGELDGADFRPTQDARWLDHGADFYAAVSYADAPSPLVQGWMSNWTYADLVPAATHRGAMTLARRLVLRPRDGELVLVQRPVVRDSPVVHRLHDEPLAGTRVLPARARTCRVVLEVEPRDARRVGVRVRTGSGSGHHTTVWVEPGSGTVGLDRRASGETGFHDGFAAEHTAPLVLGGGPVRLEVVVDESSVEVFVGDGEVALTDLVFPDPGDDGLAVFAEGGTALVHHLVVHG